MTEAEAIRAKIKAREGNVGYASNVEALKRRLAEIEEKEKANDQGD